MRNVRIPGPIALLATFVALFGLAIAQDSTGTQLHKVDAKIREAEHSMAYYQKLQKDMDKLVFVQIAQGGHKAFIHVSKDEFTDWASAEILTGKLTSDDIAAMANLSAEKKKELKKGLPLLIASLQDSLTVLEAEQKELAKKLEDERKPKDPGQTLGDEWVADDPVFDYKPSDVLQVSAGSITCTNTQDGKTGTATITFSGIPKSVKEGERVKLEISVSGSPPAGGSGWFNVNCQGKIFVNEGNVSTNAGVRQSGTQEFEFRPGSDPYIQVSGGGDAVPGRWALVTWKFHKVKSDRR